MSRYASCNPEQFTYTSTDYTHQDGGAECECGGTFDQYDCCSDCDLGHDDCEINECFACFERSMDKAELYADLARDEEMGI